MQSKAEKGLIITTGWFTRGALEEAARTPVVDLIDGPALCEYLIEHRLGVLVETREIKEIVLDEKFFETI